MAISEVKLRNLKPKEKAYQEADGGGLFIEVLPGGGKVWRLRYRLFGKQEKVSLGEYPAYPPSVTVVVASNFQNPLNLRLKNDTLEKAVF